MTLDAPPPPVSTMRRDLISAYFASGMKVASWAVASATIYRFGRFDYFSVFVTARATLALLNYATVGLAPAVIHSLANADAEFATPLATPTVVTPTQPVTLSYALPQVVQAGDESAVVVFNAILTAGISLLASLCVCTIYANNFNWIHGIRASGTQYAAPGIAMSMGFSLSIRLMSEAFGAIVQAKGRLFIDNLCAIVSDAFWIVFCLTSPWSSTHATDDVLGGLFLSSALLLFLRAVAIPGKALLSTRFLHLPTVVRLLKFGSQVTFAQLADYLYAPTDFLLIGALLTVYDAAAYGPAVQIDAALLLLVGGVANVLLSKSAISHARGDRAQLSQYYFRGTIFSCSILLLAAISMWLLSGILLKLWFGDPMPATQAILPFILVHTVVGGSSAVGRSILLGMGKVKPFTIAVLVAGVSNVILSYVFVRYFNLGLKGIVLGTICAVVGRCAIWQPWYVWRSLREVHSGK